MKEKVPGKIGKGVIVSSWVTRGDPPKGVATVEYSEVYEAYSEEAFDSLSRQKVPASRRDYVRDYFDAIRGSNPAAPDKK